MFFSWYDMIVDHKGDAGTAADIEYDDGAGGGVSCHVLVQVLLFLYTMKRRCTDLQVIHAKHYLCNMSEKNVWAKMYPLQYEIIVDHEADAVT